MTNLLDALVRQQASHLINRLTGRGAVIRDVDQLRSIVEGAVMMFVTEPGTNEFWCARGDGAGRPALRPPPGLSSAASPVEAGADLKPAAGLHPAVAAQARDLIAKACARFVNCAPDTKPMSPERLRLTEAYTWLWDAKGLLCPELAHPEDRAGLEKWIEDLKSGAGVPMTLAESVAELLSTLDPETIVSRYLDGHSPRTAASMLEDVRAGTELGRQWTSNLLRVAAGMLGRGKAPPSDSCLSKRLPDEPMFVLLARDPQAPALVMRWADNRERLEGSSPKTDGARRIAADMRAWKDAHPDIGLPPIHPARDLGMEWRAMVSARVLDRAESERGGAALIEELVDLILDELVGPLPVGVDDIPPPQPVTVLGLIENLCKVPAIEDEYAFTTRTILEGLAVLRDAALRHEPQPGNVRTVAGLTGTFEDRRDVAIGQNLDSDDEMVAFAAREVEAFYRAEITAAGCTLSTTGVACVSPPADALKPLRVGGIAPERMRAIATEAGAKTDRDVTSVLATALCLEVAANVAGRRMTIDLEDISEDGASVGSFRVIVEPLAPPAAAAEGWEPQTCGNCTFDEWFAGVAKMVGTSALEADEWRPYYVAGYDRGEAWEALKSGDEPLTIPAAES